MNPHYHYTPHHEPSPPSTSGPTTHYLAVSSSSSSSTNAVIVRHRHHRCHHGVGCCLVPPAATISLTIVVHCRRNPTNDGVPAASPRPPPPPAIPSPPSRPRPLRPLDRTWRHHGQACGVDALPPGPTRQVPLPYTPPLSGYGPIAPALPSLSGGSASVTLRRLAVYPPSLLGPPMPVRQRRRQHGYVDGRPWQPSAATTTPRR